MYFVAITVTFINQSGNPIPSKEYYRIVYTTGIFNEDFIKYETADFKDLSVSVPITLTPNFGIDEISLTPQIDSISSVSLDSPFIGVSSIYSVNGELEINTNVDESKYFGKFKSIVKTSDDTSDTSGYGLVTTLPSKFDSYEVVDTPSYLGTSQSASSTLEEQLSNKYDPEGINDNDRGVADLESVKFSKMSDNKYGFTLGGEVRRGLYISGETSVERSAECYTLVPAVSSLQGLNEYVGCSFIGNPNTLATSNTDHLQTCGSIPMITSDANMYVGNLLGNGSLPVTPNADKNMTKLGKGNLDSIFDSNLVNTNNSSGLKHPIMFMIPDSKEQNGKLGREIYRTYNTAYEGVIHEGPKNGDHKSWGYIDDYIAVAWKISEYSYVFINMGGVIAWNNNGGDKNSYDPVPNGGKLNKENCTYEYPRTLSGKSLTILDVLYNFLSRIYIPQWRSNTTTISIPDIDSIIYHGQFNDDFTLNGTYTVDVNSKKLFSFMDASNNEIFINPEELSSYITSKLPYKEADFKEDIEKNCTVTTNLKESSTYDIVLKYSVGKNINLTEWYMKIANMALGNIKWDENKVYLPGGTTTVDGNGLELQMNSVYTLKNGKYVKYDGKVDYGNGLTSNTTSDFLVVKRPPNYKSDAILYIKPSELGKRLELIEGNNETLLNIDTKNIIYPGCNMFSI
jgi:hypothetical protein